MLRGRPGRPRGHSTARHAFQATGSAGPPEKRSWGLVLLSPTPILLPQQSALPGEALNSGCPGPHTKGAGSPWAPSGPRLAVQLPPGQPTEPRRGESPIPTGSCTLDEHSHSPGRPRAPPVTRHRDGPTRHPRALGQLTVLEETAPVPPQPRLPLAPAAPTCPRWHGFFPGLSCSWPRCLITT